MAAKQPKPMWRKKTKNKARNLQMKWDHEQMIRRAAKNVKAEAVAAAEPDTVRVDSEPSKFDLDAQEEISNK